MGGHISTIDAVLFDLGNTLIPFTPGDSMEFVLKWYFSVPGLEAAVPFPEFLESFREVVREEKGRMRSMKWEATVDTRSSMIEASLVRKGFNANGLSRLFEATHTMAFTSCLRVGAGTAQVLDRLSSMKGASGCPLKLGLVSNASDSEAIRQFLDRSGLSHYFGSIVISGEVGIAKPWPDIFLLGLDELGVSADRALFVGDRYVTDILGPKRIGMKTVYIRQYRTDGEPPEGVDIDAPVIEDIVDLVPLIERGLA
ncbi:MAG: HAD family hydrolase [Candidatus Thermoplasmatota archaeon]|nr:HAD family hydrolase [Candidatus Thermoplasmatota archaeon]